MNLSPNMFSVNDQQPTIEFSDHSGYLFVGDVFHQLHCLNYLRKKTILYNHLYLDEENDPEVPAEFHLRKLATQKDQFYTTSDKPKLIVLTLSAYLYNVMQT